MSNIKIEYHQLLFLYAYSRQIDLSLDRSRWTSWDKFQDYYSCRLQPDKVIEYLQRSFQLPNIDFEQFIFFPKKKTIIDKLEFRIRKNQFLSQGEVLYCCKLLWAFDKELKSDNKGYNLDIEKLRIDVSTFYSQILELLISHNDLNRLMKVEHYEQNDKIEVIEMSEFIPDDF